jgi:hypothetical protein
VGFAFLYGSIPAEVNGKWGYIDKSGSFFIQPRFSAAEPFSKDGIAKVRNWNGSGCINKLGESIECPQ